MFLCGKNFKNKIYAIVNFLEKGYFSYIKIIWGIEIYLSDRFGMELTYIYILSFVKFY